MTEYKVRIEPEALSDIQEITDWYNEKQTGLGKRFQDTVIEQINKLGSNPFVYAIRYNEIRCMPITKFPYMVHYYVNGDQIVVEVLAVISTDRDPKAWQRKTKRSE